MMSNVCNIYRFQNTLNYKVQWRNKKNVAIYNNLLDIGEQAVNKFYR